MAKENKPVKPESVGFLSGIDAKLAALQELRESYMRAVSVGAIGDIDFGTLGAAGGSVRSPDQSFDLPTGAFLNKSIPEAIKLLFIATKRKYTPAETAVAMRAGGYESTSQNFEKTVSGTMYRMKDQGILLKFKDGFGLAELYPEHLRAKLTETSKAAPKIPAKAPAKGRKRSKRSAAKRRKPSVRASAKVPAKTTARATPSKRWTAATGGPSIDQQILKILMNEGPNSPAAFVARLEKPANVIALALGRLAKLGKAEKVASGNYAAVKPEPVLRAV